MKPNSLGRIELGEAKENAPPDPDLPAVKVRYGTLDFETDPFLVGRVPSPFVVGVYTAEGYWYYWGDDCVEKLLEYLDTLPPTLFYAHNGGKFDYHFLIEKFVGNPIRIINARIVSAYISGKKVCHEFRDSYSILPVPLAQFDKGEIDYAKLERKVRDKHRPEILTYLQRDCVSLYNAIAEFLEEFPSGKKVKLTMSSAAMSALKRFHSYEVLHRNTDKYLRKYYFGGRNQCFETGELKGDFTIYDVNSMYPAVMKNRRHPIGKEFDFGEGRINKDTFFATVTGKNYGALPQRRADNSLDFTAPEGTFFASIHELEAAEETGTFKIDKVLETIDCHTTGNFAEFIDHFYAQRMKAKAAGQVAKTVLYKLIMNGAYGKFAQDPLKFQDYTIEFDRLPDDENFTVSYVGTNYVIYQRPAEKIFDHSFFNVATGASITGAARADLLRGIAKADRPVYCDTDSIICRGLDLPIGDKLGQWKIEARGSSLAIAGKKLYALAGAPTLDAKGERFAWKGARLEAVKKASKGVRLTARQIFEVATGKTVEYSNPVPNFRLRVIKGEAGQGLKATGGTPGFVTRAIRKRA